MSDFMQSFALLTWVRLFPHLLQSGQKASGATAVDPKRKASALAFEKLHLQE
jgi:hypothetical protein